MRSMLVKDRVYGAMHLSGLDGLAGALGTLAGGEALGDRGGLCDGLFGLGEDHLDVAGVGHVRVDLDRTGISKDRGKRK